MSEKNENLLKSELVNCITEPLAILKTKVDGGHIYNSIDKAHYMIGSVFVPDQKKEIDVLNATELLVALDAYTKHTEICNNRSISSPCICGLTQLRKKIAGVL